MAFDPARGRLWAICKECKRWSLAPIEERWEALDELEKMVRDKARLLSQTDNIALLRAGHLEIVRVGRANLAEQSWWRYGSELTKRRKNYKTLSAAGAVGAGAAIWGGMATGGLGFIAAWILWDKLPGDHSRRRPVVPVRGGRLAGRERCPTAAGSLMSIGSPIAEGGISSFATPARGSRRPWPTGAPSVGTTGRGVSTWRAAQAEHTLRRVLAYHHFEGASERTVDQRHPTHPGGGLTHGPHADPPEGGQEARGSGTDRRNRPGDRRQRVLRTASPGAGAERNWRLIGKRRRSWRAIIDGELTPLPLLEVHPPPGGRPTLTACRAGGFPLAGPVGFAPHCRSPTLAFQVRLLRASGARPKAQARALYPNLISREDTPMRRKHRGYVTLLLLTSLATGCGEGADQAPPDPRPVVVVSIFPIGDLVRAVGRRQGQGRSTPPPGSLPATFDVTPRQLGT